MASTLTFRDLLRTSLNRHRVALLGFLYWVASADGEITAEEGARLAESAKGIAEIATGQHATMLSSITVEDLEAASQALSEVRQPAAQREVLRQVISMALIDRRLSPGENHVIRFAGDLLGVLAGELNGLFLEMTGRSFPEPGDPSSAAWWQRKEEDARHASAAAESERRRGESTADKRSTDNVGGGTPPNQKYQRALAVLGLEYGATADEIREAYLRLAQIHHPDRFQHLNPDATARANETFRRIQEAYELLIGK